MTTLDDPSTLNARLAALKASSKGRLPPEVSSAFDDDRDRMVDDGTRMTVAQPGVAMPEGQLLDTSSRPTTLAAALAGRVGVVVFYRGAWCPYCNLTLRSYQQELVPELTRREATLVAISPQTPDGAITVQQANDLTYTVLSDPGNSIASQLGIVTFIGDDARAAGRALGVDHAATNADGTAAVPMPTVAVVDAAGVLRWIDVHPDFTTRTETAAILAAVDSL